MLLLRVLEFLSHFLGFIIATGLRHREAIRELNLQCLLCITACTDELQRYEWISAETLTSWLFSVSDFRNIFTYHEETQSTRQGHIQGAGLVLCLALCAQLCLLQRFSLG